MASALRAAIEIIVIVLVSPRVTPSTSKPVVFRMAKYHTVLRMEAYGNCPAQPGEHHVDSTLSRFVEAGIRPFGRTTVAWSVVNVTRDVRRFTQAVATISRCADRTDPACSEIWERWRFNAEDNCRQLKLRNMMWSPLFNAEPPFGCPMSKGIYRQDNVTLNVDAFITTLGFSSTNYYKTRIDIDADGRRFINICFEAAAVRLKE